MSLQSAKAFLKKVGEDEEFKKLLEKAENDNERQKIVKDAGFDFTKEELKEAISGSGELSDEDLEKVAGGSAGTWAYGVVAYVAGAL